MKHVGQKKSWNLHLNDKYEPYTTVIISTYNEAPVITRRLQNLEELEYPRDKIEVIVADSASSDGTADIVDRYVKNHGFPFGILVLREKQRKGKAKAMNLALQHAKGEVIATSDADSYWDPKALRIALSFMADPKVGAVTGREMLTNIGRSTYTMAEDTYSGFNRTIRYGESKLGSTLIFQGELSLYKRKAFEQFEDKSGSDDVGTVISIVANGYRTLFVPTATFHDAAHYTLSGRMTVKTRRAQHLIYGVLNASRLKLRLRKRMPISVSTVFMNLYLYVLNPIIGVLLVGALIFLAISFPILLLGLLLLPVLLLRKSRIMLISYLTSNVALLLALARCVAGDRQVTWKKIDETRYQ